MSPEVVDGLSPRRQTDMPDSVHNVPSRKLVLLQFIELNKMACASVLALLVLLATLANLTLEVLQHENGSSSDSSGNSTSMMKKVLREMGRLSRKLIKSHLEGSTDSGNGTSQK